MKDDDDEGLSDEANQDDGEMPWESSAQGRVKEALEHIRFDEVRGVKPEAR